mgnify:CR=1 FL=1
MYIAAYRDDTRGFERDIAEVTAVLSVPLYQAGSVDSRVREAKQTASQRRILVDEPGSMGMAYGAKTTPHMFIVDKEGKIAYNGAIDDDPQGRNEMMKRLNYVNAGLTAEKAGKIKPGNGWSKCSFSRR